MPRISAVQSVEKMKRYQFIGLPLSYIYIPSPIKHSDFIFGFISCLTLLLLLPFSASHFFFLSFQFLVLFEFGHCFFVLIVC